MKKTPTVLGRRYNHKKSELVTIVIPCRRLTSPNLAKVAMQMSKRNHKIYADISTYLMSVLRMCPVLGTGAGPNLSSRNNLTRTVVKIKSGDKPVISDANGRALNTVGITALFVIFGTYVVKLDFYVFEKLTTDYLVEGCFCEKFLN